LRAKYGGGSGVCHLNEQMMQVLDFLSSSSSSDDDDYLLSERRIIPKIPNFLKVVHNFSDNEVSFYCFFIQYITYAGN